MSPQFVRIIIKGKTAGDVQGAKLREKIQEVAKNLNIDGEVRNIKGKSKVEIICKKDKNYELFFEKLKKLKERGGSLYKIKTIRKKKLLFKFNSFEVNREDDFSEMVWALQGAGKAFERLGNVLIKSEKERTKGKLIGLIYELNSISDKASSFEKDNITKFRLIAIENFFINCFIDDKIVITNLQTIHEECSRVNCLIEQDKEIGSDYMKRILTSSDYVKEKLNKKKKELNRILENVN